ncbi:MarR family transcriptional regulator [Sporosarcina sp. P21c]|uniref:MarR family winged helix-turn-helix transcriptional regulator n=1 Tax=Sporosarcina TaxID=1569 RepID=UPI000A16B81D|nr:MULTISPECIES: MarR family winged helix-turn-helix transcriptional regulator [Sporosarcina]ARJ38238.1 MarR family transcriptional regulator [Sporosarcina ureae]PIC66624.1 MarR family transcriptional regulator [Sporosarcina sp. P16a]PIC88737.1 MarR family transcriptional regulator [Sporosarcina sp. P21c]PIC91787.1 MarR family transcriptional regulator [Sporosarcina sp. P25]
MTKELDQEQANYIIDVCASANLRTVSGSLTQLYNHLLKPTGLKITQYYMLGNIYTSPDISISKLGEIMLLDQTTVTRNLNILHDSGFVQIKRAKQDSRTKVVTITELGYGKLNEATPIWTQVQEQIEGAIGKSEYMDLLKKLESLQKVIDEFKS